MKKNKRTENIQIKDLVYKLFMQAPFPMSITKAEDGTYVETNEASLKFVGLKREEIIGRKSSDLGHYPTEKRHLFIDAIKEQGFAKNIPLDLNIKNQGILHMLMMVYPVKMGKDSFFLSVATDVSNDHPFIKKMSDNKFVELTIQDYKFIKAKLKQYRLTPRQQEIAFLSTTGLSDSQIAKKLHISEYTVKDHMKEIRKIIGIHRRSELFAKLVNMR
jgi:PAS domain S-box-containing protein